MRQRAAVALHWKEAGHHGHAAHWCARAARWAMRTDTEEAYRHWNFVRELASDPTAGDVGDLIGQAYVALVNLGWRSGAPTEATLDHFEKGRRLLEETGDKRSLATLHSNCTLTGGIHSDVAVAHYRKAVQLAQALGDLPLEIAVGVATFPGIYNGRVRESLEWADHYVALVEANPGAGAALLHFDPDRWIYSARSWSRALLGNVAGAVEDSDRGLELARKGEAYDLFLAEHLRCRLDAWRGEFATGLEHARRQFDLSEQIGGVTTQYLALSGLGLAFSDLGEWREALPLLEESHAVQFELETYAPYPGVSSAFLHCGKPERAVEIARSDVAYCVKAGIRFSELLMQIDLARVAQACGLEADARAATARARELAETCEFLIFLPAIAEREAALEGEFGDPARRDHLLREALAEYRRMGAAGHARRLAAEIGNKVGD